MSIQQSEMRQPSLGSVVAFVFVAAVYFLLAKSSLYIAQIHPNATPIWPPAGFAIASLILGGFRLWPAIFIGALIANDTTAGSMATSAGIAVGNTLEAIIAYWLISTRSDSHKIFSTPLGVIVFTAITLFVSAPISASIGVSSLFLGGYAGANTFFAVWTTWWLGNVAGVLVVCPLIVLWFRAIRGHFKLSRPMESFAASTSALVVSVAAFAPIIDISPVHNAVAFLSVIPLLWSSLRLGPVITSTVSFIFVAIAVWGTIRGIGPFGSGSLNDDLLSLLGFAVSVTVPSLALSVELHRRSELQLSSNTVIDERTRALDQAVQTIREQTTEKEKTRHQLIEQAIHFREAQRLANLGSWTWDVATNRVTWSDQLYVIYGVSRDQFQATFQGYLDRIHEEDRESVRGIIESALKSGTNFQTEERIVRPDGEVRILRTSGEVLRNKAGSPVRMLGICADITDERRSREQLLHFQKLEALGKLTGGVAHDFNNLLMIVGASAEFLEKRISDEAPLKKISAIKMAVERGTRLTSQLLSFSRHQLLNPTTVDLKSSLPAMQELVKSSLRGDISLSMDIATDLNLVNVDATQLELCILNLAVNARDAMQNGGAFRIEAKNVELEGEVLSLCGAFVLLTFQDNGVGIPPENIERVFDPFFTTKQIGSGTGLGLAQAYGFAQSSGGTIVVSSVPGRTIFSLYLPCAENPVTEARQTAAHFPLPSGTKVLVVDDNVEVGTIAAEMLADVGYKVDRVTSGDQAIELLKGEWAYDLIITDVVMNGKVDGVELANIVRNEHPRTLIVLMTGYLQSRVLPIDEFTLLKKPFDRSSLAEAINAAAARSRGN